MKWQKVGNVKVLVDAYLFGWPIEEIEIENDCDFVDVELEVMGMFEKFVNIVRFESEE